MKAQDRFFKEGRPTHVDVGYHYTKPDNLESISCSGLLSLRERRDHGIVSNFNGASHGDGIYTAPNPSSFHKFGDIGVMVVRLQGTSSISPRGRNYDCDNNSVRVVKKKQRAGEESFTVLQQSCQCLPVIQFTNNMIFPNCHSYIGNQIIEEYHCGLQELVDTHFNSDRNPPLSPSRKLSPMNADSQRSPWWTFSSIKAAIRKYFSPASTSSLSFRNCGVADVHFNSSKGRYEKRLLDQS